jgi:hypothetical protein
MSDASNELRQGILHLDPCCWTHVLHVVCLLHVARHGAGQQGAVRKHPAALYNSFIGVPMPAAKSRMTYGIWTQYNIHVLHVMLLAAGTTYVQGLPKVPQLVYTAVRHQCTKRIATAAFHSPKMRPTEHCLHLCLAVHPVQVLRGLKYVPGHCSAHIQTAAFHSHK